MSNTIVANIIGLALIHTKSLCKHEYGDHVFDCLSYCCVVLYWLCKYRYCKVRYPLKEHNPLLNACRSKNRGGNISSCYSRTWLSSETPDTIRTILLPCNSVDHDKIIRWQLDCRTHVIIDKVHVHVFRIVTTFFYHPWRLQICHLSSVW
jgi:hypothetical protein